jgi:hypothetical protein
MKNVLSLPEQLGLGGWNRNSADLSCSFHGLPGNPFEITE